MDEVPGFETFESRFMGIIGGIKKAAGQGKKKMLAFYIVCIVIGLLVAFCITFSSVITSFMSFGILKDNIFAPKKELTYEQKGDSTKDGENYITIFTLKFSTPPNHLGERMLFNYPKGCDAENLIPTQMRGTNFKNGTTYAEAEYDIKCITPKPITDTVAKTLFTLR